MRCRVKKSGIKGRVECPPSKSYTHRAVFLAALAGNSTVRNALISEDTMATVEACRSLGADIATGDKTVTVGRAISPDNADVRIDARNSGTTIRIAAGIASLYDNTTKLAGDESLSRRPMQPLLDALGQMGAECGSDSGHPPMSVRGPIKGGAVEIPGNESSQFISSLLVCAPMTELGMDVRIRGGLVSKPYVDATIAAMREFGGRVKVVQSHERYVVEPGGYSGATFDVPSDASSMALLLAAGALNGSIEVAVDTKNLPQGDLKFVDMLKKIGAEVREGDTIKVSTADNLLGGVFDLRDNPDLLPPLAILALKSSDPITIKDVGHARIKETDRVALVTSELEKLGVEVTYLEGDDFELRRPKEARGAHLDPRGDHRLFMAFCIAGMYVGDCTVSDPESAAVSYPGFVEEMGRLGAGISPE